MANKLDLIPLINGPGHFGLEVPTGTEFLDITLLSIQEKRRVVVPGQSVGDCMPAIVASVPDGIEEKTTFPIHVVVAGTPIPPDAKRLIGTTSLGEIVVAVYHGDAPPTAPSTH
jgi:hypothetical protein